MNKEKENSGKSKSLMFQFGRRRKVGGKELAPRSIRKLGKIFLSECTEKELVKAGLK